MVKLKPTHLVPVVASGLGQDFSLIDPSLSGSHDMAGMPLSAIRAVYSDQRALLAGGGWEAWPVFSTDDTCPYTTSISSLHVWLVIRFFAGLKAHDEAAFWSLDALDSEFLHGFEAAVAKHYGNFLSVRVGDLGMEFRSAAHAKDLMKSLKTAQEFLCHFVAEALPGVLHSTPGNVEIPATENAAVPLRHRRVFGNHPRDDGPPVISANSADILPFPPRRLGA